MQVLDSGGVDYDVVHVPQVDVGQIAGQDALDLGVNLPALFLVQRSVAFLKQVVHLGIGVTAPIGPLGREAGRVKSVFEDIRVLIAVTHPAQRIELKCAF